MAFCALVILVDGVWLRAVAPWGAGLLAFALALAFWSLLVNASPGWSIGAAAASFVVALLLARVVARRKTSGGTLVLALLGVSVLTLVLNAVFLFVIAISSQSP
jgi:hypothetical protein